MEKAETKRTKKKLKKKHTVQVYFKNVPRHALSPLWEDWVPQTNKKFFLFPLAKHHVPLNYKLGHVT